jgi:catechol 2,3-dioxygenase-like lactoylglutathione lyase family enzyme
MLLRKALRAALALAGITAVANAHGQGTPGNPIPEGFRVAPLARATIFVRNQEESLKLYRDILGLRVRVDKEFADERFNRILGTQGLETRVKILQSGDTVYGNLGVFELAGDDRADVPRPSRETGARTGDVAVVFLTNDIEGIAAKVTAAGYTIIAPPMVLFPDETLRVQPREMLFRDRDGVLVNLIQLGSK